MRRSILTCLGCWLAWGGGAFGQPPGVPGGVGEGPALPGTGVSVGALGWEGAGELAPPADTPPPGPETPLHVPTSRAAAPRYPVISSGLETPSAPAPLPSSPAPGEGAPPATAFGGAGGCPPGGCGTAACGPTGCCDLPCEPCCPCPLWGRTWVTAEWLYWVTNGYHVPPLVTASPAGTPVAASGVLSDPGTVVLLGGRNLQSGDLRNGLRVHGGLWLDRCETVGIEGSYFFLEDRRDGGSFVSSGVPQLSRPFFNASTGAPDAELVAFPGVVGGSVSVDSGSSFWGADANLRKMLCCDCNYRVDCLAGYRYLNLDETLTISEVLTVPPDGAGIPPGTRLFVRDRFRTLNEFHGGQIGLAARLLAGRAWADVTGKVALGVTRKLIDIGGDTTVLVPGQAPSPRPGGLLAQRTNSGRFRSDDFAVVPEATVRLGYRLTDNISAFAGYTFLYWSDVARPGDQIDTVLNPTQIPPGTLQGPARPAFLDGDSDFWVQGVSVGLEVRY